MEAPAGPAESDKSESHHPVLCERCACVVDKDTCEDASHDNELKIDLQHLATALTPQGNTAMPAPGVHQAGPFPSIDEIYDQWVSDLAKQSALDSEESAKASTGAGDYKPLLLQTNLRVVEDVQRPGGMPVAVKPVGVTRTDPRVFGIWFAADLALRVLEHPSSVDVLVRIARSADSTRSAADWATGVKGFLVRLRRNFPTVCITGRAAASTADIAGNKINLDKSVS